MEWLIGLVVLCFAGVAVSRFVQGWRGIGDGVFPGEAYGEVKVATQEVVDEPGIVDLRELDSVRMRVKGTAAYVPDRQRRQVGGSAYTLVREPNNAHDPNAVAVLGREGRKVGYVSAARAAILAPLLDQLGADGYRVAGADATEYSVKLWVDIPKVDAMRTFVKSMIG